LIMLIGFCSIAIREANSAELTMPAKAVIGEGGDCIAQRVLAPDSTYEDFLRMDCEYLMNLNKIEPEAGEEKEGWYPPPMPANNGEHTIIYE